MFLHERLHSTCSSLVPAVDQQVRHATLRIHYSSGTLLTFLGNCLLDFVRVKASCEAVAGFMHKRFVFIGGQK